MTISDALRQEAAAIADTHPHIQQPESRRYQILRMAQALKDDDIGSPFYVAVSGYAISLSWLPADIAALSFAALVGAVKRRDMDEISSTLNELLAGGS